MTAAGQVRLWHIPVSHYNEKVRWALDLKDVEHDRRAPIPGTHPAFSLWLTRGRSATFPLLEIGGGAIGDSTAIIAELEQRFPNPPLYPADPAERERALALEDHFDEELGPYSRRLAFHFLRGDPGAAAKFAVGMLPGNPAADGLVGTAMGRVASAFVGLRYRAADEEGAEEARARVEAALDRLEAELAGNGGEYLVGDSFSVADLTAASLFVPLVIPPEGPQLPPMPRAYETWREGLRDRPGYRWVAEMFRRHRPDPRRP